MTKDKNDEPTHSFANILDKEGSLGSKRSDDVEATANVGLTDAQLWTNFYGALILFFEENGHTNVPSDHNNPELVRWVTVQRGRFAELSPLQVKQLRIFDFRFPGQPQSLPVEVGRCSHEACNKFAAFNGLCHEHFSKKPAIASTTAAPTNETKTPRPEFPLKGLRKKGNGNYDIESTKEKVKDITRDEVIDKLHAFIQKISQNNCFGKQGHPTSCTCMKFLSDKPFIIESVSHAIMDYSDLTALQRKHYAVERLRYAEMGKRKDHYCMKGPQRIFYLPLSYECFEEHPQFVRDEDDVVRIPGGDSSQELIGQAFKHRICAHAFHNLHNIGVKACQTLNKYANGDLSVGMHGNSGRKWAGAQKFREAYQSLRDSLNMLMEEYREHGPDDDVILPLHMSRRKWFQRWSRERGWDIKKLNKATGQYEGSEAWETLPGRYRTEEEAVANGGDVRNVAKTPISWTVFNNFWNAEFPQLKTQGRVGKGMFGGAYDFEKKKYYTRKN